MSELIQARWYQEQSVDALFNYYMTPRPLDEYGKPVRKNALICLPTGTGKSFVIAKFLHRAFDKYPTTRAVMSTHVKTLIKQNANKLQEYWPIAPLGLYSAGLKTRDQVQPIIFGGIQSMQGKLDLRTTTSLFGFRDFLIIDEAHLLSDDGRYLKFIEELISINPYLKIIGLSATPYRAGMGLLTYGKIFTDVVYDICNMEGFQRLIAEGYIAPLIPARGNVIIDTTGISVSDNGDYNQTELQKVADDYETTFKALSEVVVRGKDRKSWMIFATGTEHADNIAAMLQNIFGIDCVSIHSKKSEIANDKAIAAWKAGEVRCAVSMGMLTTGVDHPPCDLIAMLRPTMSTGLWIQMIGRGTRPYSYLTTSDPVLAAAFPFVKLNCLVLDFTANTRNLGPIDDPVIPKPRGSGTREIGVAPVKLCKQCQCYNNTRATVCFYCGAEFPASENFNESAGNLELMRGISEIPIVETFDIRQQILTLHRVKITGEEMIKVSYFSTLSTFFEFVNFETNVGYSKKIAYDWFRQRFPYDKFPQIAPGEVPKTNAEVLDWMATLLAPRQIEVWTNAGKYPKVQRAIF